MQFKQKIYQACLRSLDEKISLFESALAELRASVANETKSSAGDKYETARAMLQIEQDNIGRQLNEVRAQKKQLETINVFSAIPKLGNMLSAGIP